MPKTSALYEFILDEPGRTRTLPSHRFFVSVHCITHAADAILSEKIDASVTATAVPFLIALTIVVPLLEKVENRRRLCREGMDV